MDAVLDPRPLLVSPETPVREVCRIIDGNLVKIVLVVDARGRLVGTVTDGDVRRGLLKGVTVEDPARRVMFDKPVTAPAGTAREKLVSLMRLHQVAQLPLLDGTGAVAGIEVLSEDVHVSEPLDNPVVIFAGGLGRRLRPLTDNLPKPMLPVGGKPLLELLLERVAAQGFRRFFLAVHYREEMIERHIGDGARLGIQVRYLREPEPLGTAGALRLARRDLDRDFVVMNADLLTSINLFHLVSFHREGGHAATLAVREYASRVPFGVLSLDGERVTDFVEKPASSHFVYAGVAVLGPALLRFVPETGGFDMPDLVRAALAARERVSAFPVREYWLDIGRPEDYRKAVEETSEGEGTNR